MVLSLAIKDASAMTVTMPVQQGRWPGRNMIVLLPLLLVSLTLLCPPQCPCCTDIIAIIALSSAIKDASVTTTAATTPVQQGHWHRCSSGKGASNRGNTSIKDGRATTATMPVQQGHCCGRNDSKDASNRGNMTGNNQPTQQKDKRAD